MKLKVEASLDKGFMPLSVVFRDYQNDLKNYNNPARLVVAIERSQGCVSAWECRIFPDGVQQERTIELFDRIVKTLLWIRGGFKIKLAGSKALFEHLKNAYTDKGSRSFDKGFMETVYETEFLVEYHESCDEIAESVEGTSNIGRHLDGCRIGFDAGGSDRKVSAVIDGKAVYSEEVVWHPKVTADPNYHYEGILSAMKAAASHMPRVDAIGVSSAGVYIDNKVMVASLFLKVPKEQFETKVKTIYTDIAKELGNIPIVVANDGDVTALAGAMNMNVGNVLGIAMGTSEAGGYVDENMCIKGWLNELAFAPVDASKEAMLDEWSLDIGCGVKYFSQDAVIKLAPNAGIELDEKLTPAEKLKVVQELMEKDHEGAKKIYESIGVYFGYAIAYYSLFLNVEHVLIMGRVTSGKGGQIILDKANEVLSKEFEDLYKKIKLHIPDENDRRVGQSVAAASLPEIIK